MDHPPPGATRPTPSPRTSTATSVPPSSVRRQTSSTRRSGGDRCCTPAALLHPLLYSRERRDRLLGRPASELRSHCRADQPDQPGVLRSAGCGQTDPVDAVAIARITAREPNLPAVRLAVGQAADLRALADYRAQLVAERTALANRTHTELHGLLPGYQAEIPRLTAPTFIAAATDRLAGESSVRAQLIRRRLIRLAEPTAEIREVAAIINAAVAEVTTGLTGLYGLGPVGAATILGEVADVRRYRSRHAFAAANGTAPLPASSGRTTRHRLNRSGTAPESGARRDGDHPDPRRHRRPRLLPAQTRRRQDRPRSAALPGTTTLRRGLQDAAGRPRRRPSTHRSMQTVSAAAARGTRLHGQSQLRDRFSVPGLLSAAASPPHPPPAETPRPAGVDTQELMSVRQRERLGRAEVAAPWPRAPDEEPATAAQHRPRISRGSDGGRPRRRAARR